MPNHWASWLAGIPPIALQTGDELCIEICRASAPVEAGGPALQQSPVDQTRRDWARSHLTRHASLSELAISPGWGHTSTTPTPRPTRVRPCPPLARPLASPPRDTVASTRGAAKGSDLSVFPPPLPTHRSGQGVLHMDEAAARPVARPSAYRRQPPSTDTSCVMHAPHTPGPPPRREVGQSATARRAPPAYLLCQLLGPATFLAHMHSSPPWSRCVPAPLVHFHRLLHPCQVDPLWCGQWLGLSATPASLCIAPPPSR